MKTHTENCDDKKYLYNYQSSKYPQVNIITFIEDGHDYHTTHLIPSSHYQPIRLTRLKINNKEMKHLIILFRIFLLLPTLICQPNFMI